MNKNGKKKRKEKREKQKDKKKQKKYFLNWSLQWWHSNDLYKKKFILGQLEVKDLSNFLKSLKFLDSLKS